FGVIHMNTEPGKNVAEKCTFCYDRLQQGLTPACAQACPTQSIRFGPLAQLRQQAKERVAQLQQQGETGAYLYGADDSVLGGLNASYLLVDNPEVYGLPSAPKLPSRSLPFSTFWGTLAALMTGVAALFAFRQRTERPAGTDTGRAATGDREHRPAEPAAQPSPTPPHTEVS